MSGDDEDWKSGMRGGGSWGRKYENKERQTVNQSQRQQGVEGKKAGTCDITMDHASRYSSSSYSLPKVL